MPRDRPNRADVLTLPNIDALTSLAVLNGICCHVSCCTFASAACISRRTQSERVPVAAGYDPVSGIVIAMAELARATNDKRIFNIVISPSEPDDEQYREG